MRILFGAAALILLTRSAAGQETIPRRSFEVASVKPSGAPTKTKDEYTAGYNAGMRAALSSFGIRITGQRINITDNSLRDLIRLAYAVKDYQITAPGWMDTEKYEVVANMPPGADASQAPEMLQTLLETRFHLRLHRETKRMAVYALTVKGEPKLQVAEKAGRSPGFTTGRDGAGRVAGSGITLAGFADLLSKLADQPVIDGTGLGGVYNFDVRFGVQGGNDAPPLSAALGELGLKLERRDVAMEVLVVESADKVPTEN